MKAEPELLAKTPFGKTKADIAGSEFWYWLKVARISAIRGNWRDFDRILDTLWKDPSAQGEVLQVRLISLAERLHSDPLPNPEVLERHLEDLRLANELGKGPAVVEAIWLGATQDPPSTSRLVRCLDGPSNGTISWRSKTCEMRSASRGASRVGP